MLLWSQDLTLKHTLLRKTASSNQSILPLPGWSKIKTRKPLAVTQRFQINHLIIQSGSVTHSFTPRFELFVVVFFLLVFGACAGVSVDDTEFMKLWGRYHLLHDFVWWYGRRWFMMSQAARSGSGGAAELNPSTHLECVVSVMNDMDRSMNWTAANCFLKIQMCFYYYCNYFT